MSLSTPVVWSDEHSRHRPEGEVWVGVQTVGTEVPERAEAIRVALLEAGGRVVAAARHPDSDVERVHDPALLAYLAGAYAAWEDAGLTTTRASLGSSPTSSRRAGEGGAPPRFRLPRAPVPGGSPTTR